MADTLLRFEDVIAVIDVHDASMGAGKYAQVATQKRADTIRDSLITRGVPGERLVARGWDAERPVASDKTREGRAQNRRVEITLSIPEECAQSMGPSCGPISRTD